MLNSISHTAARSSGLTLVELMVALAVSVVVVAAFMSSFFLIVKGSRTSIANGRLNAQLGQVMTMMSHDLHRAGFWGNATVTSSNPFVVSGSTDIQINGSSNCVLFTYDRDADGSLPSLGSGTDDERYGFRLSNNAIQYRQSGAPFDCTAANSAWTDLTDSDIVTVTAFNVVLTAESLDIDGGGSGTAVMSVRRVDVTVTGQLVDDTSVTKTVTKQIKVYNDKYIP